MDEPSQPAEFPVGESFARTLTEATQSLVCVLDREGRILLFNEACERATGFRRHELIGRDARDFVIPPEEREAFGEFLEYVWTTGTPAPQVGHWLSKNGGRRLIAWSNKPMAGTDGMPESLVTTGIDLTDREAREDDDALEGDPGAKLAQVSRLATEQRALRRVATLVASEVSPERVFTAVSEECARVLHVNASIVVRYEGDDAATIVGRHNRDSIDVFRVGERLPPEAHSAVARVLKTGVPARVDDWGGLTGEMADTIFRVGYRSTAAVPIVVAGALWGAVAIASEDPLRRRQRGPPRRLLRAGLARRRQRSGPRRPHRVARAPGPGRRRPAPQARAQPARRRAAALRLRRAQAAPGPGAAGLAPAGHRRPAGGRCRASSTPGCASCVRSRGACTRRSSASRASCARWRRWPRGSRCPVDIEADPERLPEHIEATAYYIVSEALTNVAKHAGADARLASRSGATAPSCAARSPTTAAAGPTRRAAPASSACAIAPRPPAGRCRSSARRGAGPS